MATGRIKGHSNARRLAWIWGIISVACALNPRASLAQWQQSAAVYDLDEWKVDWSPTHGLRVDAHRIVRVNRSAGADVGKIRIWDTFFQRLVKFEGEVRDTLGRVLFTVGPTEVRSVAPFSEFRLYSGDVVRAIDLVAPSPPYVIEARWTVEIENPFFWPDWVLADHWPRRHAAYEVAVPPDREIRTRVEAPGLARHLEHRSRREVTTWELHNWTPPDTTPGEGNGIYPLVHVAPVEFRVGRLNGRTDSWDALAKWYWQLTEGRLDLTAEQGREVDARIKELIGDRARAAALKEWVSERWRYVAIEVGLGGWRPNPARAVFANRYGDCKDVVFLWVAMMRKAGLNARPALIRARNPLPIDPEFPKDWFDHVIGMTVIDGDTLWADPSDPRYPLGTLPRACEARSALVIDSAAGRLVYTPSQSSQENRLVAHVEGQVDSAGTLSFSARILAGGHFARRLPLVLGSGEKPDLAAILGISRPVLTGQLDSSRAISAEAIALAIHGQITNWALAGPKQILIHPSLAGWVPADTLGGRADPGYADFPQIADDTLIVRLPSGWTPELWPAAAYHSEATGEFGEKRELIDGTLTVIRHLRSDAPGRSESERAASARLRASYRSARTADWLFHIGDATAPSDSGHSAPGSGMGGLSRANGDSTGRSDPDTLPNWSPKH